MNETLDTEVAIIGGGPAGMLLSLLLAREGVRTVVLERHADFAREYRGEVLMPRFSRLFHQLGLDELIAGLPHRRLDALWIHDQERKIAEVRFDRFEHEFPYALWIPQTILLDALAAAAKPYAAHRLLLGTTLRDLVRDHEKVTGLVAERGEDLLEIRANVVVGADGRFSSVRRLGRFEIEYEAHDFDVLWFTLPDDGGGEVAAVRGYLSPARGYLALPKYPASLQCGMLLPPNGFAYYREHGVEALRKHLLEGPKFLHDFARSIHDLKPFTLLHANLDLVRDWERDGLVLIGDAAHTCSPAGAVGVSIAAETAAVAADVLIDCVRRSDFSKAALDRIQARREPAIRQVHARQRRIGTQLAGSALGRRIATLVIPWLSKLHLPERLFGPLACGEALELDVVRRSPGPPN